MRSALRTKRYLAHKERARQFITERLEIINRQYQFEYNRIAIRDTKTRWGSCSANKNLNFSYKLIFIPVYLADYVIAHELCHLAHMNHSRSFWELVSQVVPNISECKRDLHLEAIRLRNS